MTRSLLQNGVFLVAVLVALKLLVWLIESRMAFFPMRGEQVTPAAHGVPFESLSLDTSDRESIHGWLLEHPTARATIVYWHGNGGNLSVWLDQIVAIYRQQLTVIAIDYRGYGLSSGRPTEQGVYRDTDALVSYVRDRFQRPEGPLVYWGRSLGGPIAAYAATVLPPDGVVLESTFPDVQALLRRNPIMAVLGLFSSYRFPTLEFLQGYERPILVIHANEDEIVPYDLGVRLHARLGRNASMVTLARGGHNDLHGPTERIYWAPIVEFVDGLEHTRRRPTS